jgi:hypothetical protein
MDNFNCPNPSNRIPTALAHSPAFLYGFGLGKNAGLRGYYIQQDRKNIGDISIGDGRDGDSDDNRNNIVS